MDYKHKPMNLDTVKKLINQKGATYADLKARYGYSRSYIQKLLKPTYKTRRGYMDLLKKARLNEKAQKQAKELLTRIPAGNENQSTSCAPAEEVTEVIVTETGYLMKFGMQGILAESLDIIIPHFCVKELEKLARSNTSAEEALQLIRSTDRLTIINLEEEVLFEEPAYQVKDRTLGVVALCCDLYTNDVKIRLLTTSYDIANLAKTQGFGPDVKVELYTKS